MDTEYYFINKNFENELRNNTINNIFPNLNSDHKNMLFEYLINVIDVIAIKFNFDLNKREVYENQFRQNNYRDTVGLLYTLLPFINDTTGEKKRKIISLNELYIKKEENSPADINNGLPKYLYTNIEYGRCKRNNSFGREFAQEIEFSKELVSFIGEWKTKPGNLIMVLHRVQILTYDLE